MSITATSIAGGVGVTANNVSFSPAPTVLKRKILCIGDYDQTITSVVENVPVRVSNERDAGSKFGFGHMLHRLAKAAFKSCGGVEVYCLPVTQGGTPVAAEYTITLTGTNSAAGTFSLYLNGELIEVSVAASTSVTNQALALKAAINAITDCIFTADSAVGVLTLTAKSAGAYFAGASSVVALNQLRGQTLPAGVAAVIASSVTGSGAVPDVGAALDAALGTGDQANHDGFTDVVHGYGSNATVLADISAYVGAGNAEVGLYLNTVARPFRALSGHSDTSVANLTAIGDLYITDRANGLVGVSAAVLTQPIEVAAEILGAIAKLNNDRAEASFDGTLLAGVTVSEVTAPVWEGEYDDRNTLELAGITPLLIKNGSAYIDKVMSFYRPADVLPESNGYRSMRNISVTQNVMAYVKAVFESSKWKGITIVADVSRVTATASRQKARDIDAVKAELLAILGAFEANAWIYSAAPSIAALKADPNAVTIRAGGTGFDAVLKLVYSGEGGILNTEVQFDTNIAATTL